MSPHGREKESTECLSPRSHEEWNQMQSQEEEAAITEQDLELIKERETAIQQLEVRAGYGVGLAQVSAGIRGFFSPRLIWKGLD